MPSFRQVPNLKSTSEETANSQLPIQETGGDQAITSLASMNIADPGTHTSIRTSFPDKGELTEDTFFTGIKTIELDGKYFDVNITTHLAEKVLISKEIKIETIGQVYNKPDYKIKYERGDSVLKIFVVNKNINTIILSGYLKEILKLNLTLPLETNITVRNISGDVTAKGLQGEICNINTLSGDIVVENINTDLTIKSVSGNITASTVHGNILGFSSSGSLVFKNTTGEIKSKTVSGDIVVNGSQGNLFNIQTSSGNLSLEDIASHSLLRTVSGDIYGKNMKGDLEGYSSSGAQQYKAFLGDLRLHSVSGNVELEDAEGNADIHTSSGNIGLKTFKGNVLLKTVSGFLTGHHIELIDKMNAQSSSGNIRMDIVNPITSLSFDLQSGSGNIAVDKEGKHLVPEQHHLVEKKGNILITGYSISGNQSYK